MNLTWALGQGHFSMLKEFRKSFISLQCMSDQTIVSKTQTDPKGFDGLVMALLGSLCCKSKSRLPVGKTLAIIQGKLRASSVKSEQTRKNRQGEGSRQD